MLIEHIAMENIKTCNVNTDLSRFNVIQGKNGSGKTAFLQGIKYLLTGKLSPENIRMGEGYASVDGVINGIGALSRTQYASTRPSKTRLNLRSATQKSVAEYFQSITGVSPATSNIMMPGNLEEMFGRDLSSYMLNEGFLKNDMDVNKLLSLGAFSKAAEHEIRMHLPEAPAVISLEDLNEISDYYNDMRKAVKKDLAAAEARAKYEGPAPSETSKEIKQRIKKLNEELWKSSAEAKSYKSLFDAEAKRLAQIETLKTKIASITVKNPTPYEIKLLADSIQKTDELLMKTEASRQQAQKENVNLQMIIEKLASSVCPISAALVCTTDKTSVRTELETRIDDNIELIDTLTADVARLREERLELSKQKAQQDDTKNKWRDKLLYTQQLNDLLKNSVKVTAPPDAEHIKELQNQIIVAEKDAEIAVGYEMAKQAEADVDKLKDAVAVAEELVAAFAPNSGIRKLILEHNVAPLQTYCNEKMKKVLPKYTMEFDMENGLQLRFLNDKGDSIEYEGLSRGERMRALFVVADMLNALNGFKMLIIDDLDGLDKESLTALFDVIIENIEDYDQIFIASIDTVEFIDVVKKASVKCPINVIKM